MWPELSQDHGCLRLNLSTQAPEARDPQGEGIKLRGHHVHGMTQGGAYYDHPRAPTWGSEQPETAETALDLGWARTGGDWGGRAGAGEQTE